MSAIVRALVSEYAKVNSRNVVDAVLLEKIDLDRAVNYLYNNKKLNDRERKVLLYASYGHNHSSGARELGISRWLYKRLLHSACRKIAKYLGWEYSDHRIMSFAEKADQHRIKEALQQFSTFRSD